MIRRPDAVALTLLLALPSAAPATTLLTGQVRAVDAQILYTPPSNSSPVVLRYYLPDGSRVRKGEVLVRIDPGQFATLVRDAKAQIEQAQARVDKEVAALKVKVVDAQIAQVDAQAALDDAQVDAAIPRQLISALDYDRYQGQALRAKNELALKRKELAAAQTAVARRVEDGKLEVANLTLQADYAGTQVGMAQVVADRDGVLLHAFDSESENGGRIDEGASSFPGREIGEVVGAGPMAVRAWVIESDRAGLRVGERVGLVFDAWPGRRMAGHVSAIGGAPEAKAEWGRGHYFQVDVAIDGTPPTALRPGMSVRVEVGSAPADGGKGHA